MTVSGDFTVDNTYFLLNDVAEALMKTFMKHPTMNLLLALQRELLNIPQNKCLYFFPAPEKDVFCFCSDLSVNAVVSSAFTHIP